MKSTRPMNLGLIIRKAYYTIFLILMIFTIQQALSIKVEDILSVIKIGSASILVILSFVSMATYFLLNYLNFSIKSSMDKLSTVEFIEIETFWKQAYDYATKKMVLFGGILGFTVVIEYLIFTVFK